MDDLQCKTEWSFICCRYSERSIKFHQALLQNLSLLVVMISSYRIGQPMLIDGNIWYRLDNYVTSSWMTYNVKLKSHSFAATIPDEILAITPINGLCVTDGHFIYLFEKDQNITVYDTQNNVYSIKITTNKPPPFYGDRFSVVFNGNIFMTDSMINIKSQRFRSLTPTNNVRPRYNYRIFMQRQYIKDQKTDELLTRHHERMGYHLIQDLEETDDGYVWKFSDCHPVIPCTSISKNFVLYDHYVFSSFNGIKNGKSVDLSIQDIEHDVDQNGDLKSCWIRDIDVSFDVNGMIVVDHYDDMNKFIVSRFVKQINNKLYIPDDISSLIVLFHGDYYNKKIHFFAEVVDGADLKEGHHSYHDEMSLGVAINTFIQNTQKKEVKQEQATKVIEIAEEKDEVKEFENVLNEWKSMKNEQDELNEKLLKGYERLLKQRKKIVERERKEIETEDDEVNALGNMVNEWNSTKNGHDELIKKLLKEYERLNERNKSLKQKLKVIKN